MPKITFIQSDGSSKVVNADVGQSVMQVATSTGVQGIVAECGGSAMCATCHVYVEDAWVDKLSSALSNELEMLDCTASERLPTSRLSCQIMITPELDGLVLRLPQAQ